MKKLLKYKKLIVFTFLFMTLSSVFSMSVCLAEKPKTDEKKEEEYLLDDIYYAMDIVYELIDQKKDLIPMEKRINLEKILNGTKFYLDGFITTDNYKQLVAINLSIKGNDIEDLKVRNMIDNSINRIVQVSTTYKEENDSAREDLDVISEKRNTVYADTEEVKMSDAPFNKKLFLALNKLVAVAAVIVMIYFAITII